MSAAATHALTFGFPVPGGERTSRGWVRHWAGCGVMGILNVTPDSFSDGGQHLGLDAALASARRMRDQGGAGPTPAKAVQAAPAAVPRRDFFLLGDLRW